MIWLIVFVCLINELQRRMRYIKYSALSSLALLAIFFILYIVKVGIKGCFIYITFDDLKHFTDLKTWILVFQHVLFTLGTGTGTVVAFSSYNSFHSMNVKRHVAAINIISFIVNVFSGIITIGRVGMLSNGTNIDTPVST